jgi:hypothetical protein
MRWFGLASGSVGLLMTGLGALSGDPLGTILQNGLGWFGLGAFWLWVGPALLKVATRWELARQSTRAPGEMEQLTFGEAGFSPSQQWLQPMPWSFVDRVVETERFLLIHHGNSADPFYLPKHALSPQTTEKLFAVLRQQLCGRNSCSCSRGLPNVCCSRRQSSCMRAGTRAARVQRAVLSDSPQLNAIR